MQLLHSGIKGGAKYTEKARMFCLSLHYYSPRAYDFLRETFENNLPHSKTIKSWYANSDLRGDPGIQEDNIKRLKQFAKRFEDEHGSRIMCSLVFDEMFIRKQVFWSLQQLDYIGHIDFGQDSISEEKTIAKQVMLFMLNGLNVDFEFPVAYFFIDTLNAQQRKDLLLEIIKCVTSCGVRITNLTFDGYSANTTMCKLFGANLDIASPSFQTFFRNPFNDDEIYVILDPCHMEKLVRNALATKKIFYDSQNRKIEWRYFEALYNFSREVNFRTHKLSKKHIEWYRNPMNVRIAVQTLSDSVADSMQFLLTQGHPEFVGAEATIEFIRKMNTLFDIFNTRHTQNENIFKKAMSPGNKRIVFNYFQSCIDYFKALKLEDVSKGKSKKVKVVSLVTSRRRTAFRGFIIDMNSVMLMYEKFVEQESVLNTLPTYYLLQDVIKIFFGKIRANCGYNNNPNVNQFKGAYRKIQGNLNIKPSDTGNCRLFDKSLPNNFLYSDVYFVSSKRSTIEPIDTEELFEQQKNDILTEVAILDQVESCNSLLDTATQISTLHIVAMIEKKISTCPQFYCTFCQTVLQKNEKIDPIDSTLLDWIPCKSTLSICKNAERYFKLYDVRSNSKPRYDFKVLYCLIFRSLDFNALYVNSKFECDIEKY